MILIQTHLLGKQNINLIQVPLARVRAEEFKMKQIIVNLSDETINRKISSFVSSDKPSCCEEFANSISTYGDGGTYPSVEGVSVQFFELEVDCVFII